MSSTHPSLEVLPNTARLHTHSEVLLIYPEDLVHLGHVQGDYGSLLLRGALQRSGYIGTPCIGE